MPFCRKCGRRLIEYSKNCPDCGTSTTAPMINLKKASVSHNFKTPEKSKVVRAVLPPASPVRIKVKTAASKHAESAKSDIAAEIVIPPMANTLIQAKHASKNTLGAYVPVKIFAPPKEKPPAKPVFSAKHKLKNKSKALPQTRSVVQLIKLKVPGKPVAVQAKPASPIKPVEPKKPVASPKPITPAPVYPPHEIIKSKVSIAQDIIANPHDYETQVFKFDLTCPNGHFWPEDSALPISKGKAYCPLCGEQLRKPKKKRRQRYRRF